MRFQKNRRKKNDAGLHVYIHTEMLYASPSKRPQEKNKRDILEPEKGEKPNIKVRKKALKRLRLTRKMSDRKRKLQTVRYSPPDDFLQMRKTPSMATG